MYRLLAAIDSDQEHSEQLAEVITEIPVDREKVEVVLLNVFEEVEAVGEEGKVDSAQLYDESDYPQALTDVAETLASIGFDVTKRREHGDPVETITAVAEEIDADCITVGGQRRSPTGKAIFGSVTQSVLLSADQPVLVIMGD
jgi:nucleotide-binding universal stress UspA family protein